MEGADLSGAVLEGRYRVIERMAEGAMGVVYRGLRLKLDRAVAIKVMHASLPEAMAARSRFEREAIVMARLEHPHCVSIIDYGVHGDKPYVVMEMVRGRSLHDVLAEQRRVEIPRAADIVCQVLSGLAHAHEQGIIHRDIKPANIMLTPKAPLGVHARILDFGLARMFGESNSVSNGIAVGTPSYMAPEQCRGEQVDARTDVYACGVLLFEMLTGRKPFVAPDPIAIVKLQLQAAPPTLDSVTPGDYGDLQSIVSRALAKSAADRFPSAAAMAEALDAAVSGRTTTAAETTAEFHHLGSGDLVPVTAEPSADIPITVASSAIVVPKPPAIVTKDQHDSSVLRRMLPVSRMRWAALAVVVLTTGAVIGLIMLRRELSEPTKTDPTAVAVTADAAVSVPATDASQDPVASIVTSATELGAAGQIDRGLDIIAKARHDFPTRAELPMAAGKLYFARLWWNDGLASFREALRLDPTLRTDRELLAAATRAFLTTPEYDDRLGRFVLELGAPAAPLLDEAARTHVNPQIRARAASMAQRLH